MSRRSPHRFASPVGVLLMCMFLAACGGGSGSVGGGVSSVLESRSASAPPTSRAPAPDPSSATAESSDSGRLLPTPTRAAPGTRTETATITASRAPTETATQAAPAPTASNAAGTDDGTNSRWLWWLAAVALVAAALAAWLLARGRNSGRWRQRRDLVYLQVEAFERDDVPRVATRAPWEQANSAWQEVWPRLRLRTALAGDLDLRRTDGPGQEFLLEDSARALSTARSELRAALSDARAAVG
jgi:hypothetical protein